MAMAHRAPVPTYRRNNFISETAIIKLRERLQATQHALTAKPDVDVGNRLDEAVQNAFSQGNVEWVKDERGDKAALADISEEFQDALCAMVKHNYHAKAEFPEIVVGIFSHTHIKENLSKARWLGGQMPGWDLPLPMDKPLTTPLAPKLARAVPVKAVVAIARPLPPPRPTPTGVVRRGTAPAAPEVIFTYRTEDNVEHLEKYLKAEANEHANRIVNLPDYVPNSLEVWEKKKIKVCVEIE